MKKTFFTAAATILSLLTAGLQSAPVLAAEPICTITVSDSYKTIQGTNLGDVICITGDNNTVNALGGDDTVVDDGINNTINLGEGFDIYDGTGGDGSTVDGGAGEDSITGTPGEDELSGGDGDDTLIGGEEDDTIYGEDGDDTIAANEGDDKISGDFGEDFLDPGPGEDVCLKSDDDDLLLCEFVTVFNLTDLQRFSGVVVDSKNVPVFDASVSLSNNKGSSVQGKTDSQGKFEFVVPGGLDWVFELRGASSGNDGLPNTFGLVTSSKTGAYDMFQINKDMSVTLKLPEIKKVKISVKDEKSNPISGAIADGSSGGGYSSQEYETEGLALKAWSAVEKSAPTNSAGETFIYTFGFGFEVNVRYTAQNGTPYSEPLMISDDLPKDVTLNTATFKFSGVVVDSKNVPVFDASVSLSNNKGSSVQGKTDSQGKFEFVVPGGLDWVFELRGASSGNDGLPNTFGLVTSSKTGAYDMFQINKDMSVTLKLPEIKKVKISVKDEKSNPISGAIADGSSGGGYSSQEYETEGLALKAWSAVEKSAPTNSAGETFIYTFGFGFEVNVRYTAQNGTPYSEPLMISDDLPKDVTLNTATFKFSGVVVDSKNVPVFDASVSLSNNKGSSVQGKTDSQGKFEFVVPGGLDWVFELRGASSGNDGLPNTFGLVTSSKTGAYDMFQINKDMSVTLKLPEIKKVKISVKDEKSNPISGAIADGSSGGGYSSQEYGTEGLALKAWSAVEKSAPTNSAGETFIYTFGFGFEVNVRYTAQNGTPYSEPLMIDGRPGKPDNLSVSQLGKTSAKITWRPPIVTWGEKVSDYKVEISKDCQTFETIPHSENSATSFILNNLKSATKYCFRTSATTIYGTGEPSQIVNFSTLKSEPSAPSSLKALLLKATTATLTWRAPWAGGEPISNYKIEVSSNCGPYTTIKKTASAKLTFNLTGLKAGTKYCFRVSAVNAIGTSATSAVISAVTAGNKPAAPSSLSVKASKTSVTLSWKAATVTNGSAVRNYIVEYSKNNGGTWTKVTKPISTSRSLTITGLKTKTNYLFRVTATNDVGNSPASKSLRVTTP